MSKYPYVILIVLLSPLCLRDVKSYAKSEDPLVTKLRSVMESGICPVNLDTIKDRSLSPCDARRSYMEINICQNEIQAINIKIYEYNSFLERCRSRRAELQRGDQGRNLGSKSFGSRSSRDSSGSKLPPGFKPVEDNNGKLPPGWEDVDSESERAALTRRSRGTRGDQQLNRDAAKSFIAARKSDDVEPPPSKPRVVKSAQAEEPPAKRENPIWFTDGGAKIDDCFVGADTAAYYQVVCRGTDDKGPYLTKVRRREIEVDPPSIYNSKKKSKYQGDWKPY